MIELEFLKEQNVSESLIHGIEEFRRNYNVDEGAAARVTRPSIPFYGKEILLQAQRPREKISWQKIWHMLLAVRFIMYLSMSIQTVET